MPESGGEETPQGYWMTVQTDIEFCTQQLALVSRTFGLSIEALPESMREHVRVAYLLCRILDTIEDAVEVSLPIRRELFNLFNQCLLSEDSSVEAFELKAEALGDEAIPDNELCRRASIVFRRYWSFSDAIRDCLQQPILEMSNGMRFYVKRYAKDGQHRIHTIEDLEEYCYYVAGTVGNLLTSLFLLECPCDPATEERIHSLKRSFGLGLQMVNILKDVGDDLDRGACFLPLDQLQAVQVDPENILEPSNREAVMTVMSRVLAQAENHLENARAYIKQWPPEEGETVRMFTIVPLALAIATLAVIQKGGEGVLMKDKNPKVSREFVVQVLAATSGAAADNEQLDSLLDLAAAYEAEIKAQK